MGVKTLESEKTPNKYLFNRKAGRSIIERRPLFSPDGESVVIVVENVVRVYNIQTGDCSRILETEGSVNEIIAVDFPVDEDYNLLGCSDNGYITTWTWEQGAVLREIKLQIPEGMKILTFNLVDSNECFITYIQPPSNKMYLATYSVKDGGLLYEYKDTRPVYLDLISVSLGWCNGDRFAVIANGTKVLFIQNLYQPHLKSEILNHNQFRILAVAAHHKESAVAITDTIGRVTVLKGNLFDYKSVAREVLHWHFLPPMAVSFSVQGNYLISGGMEKVLVKWTLGHLANRASEKSFIPRLPGIIRFITTNSSHIAITLTNNSVVIASAQMRAVSTILECGGLSPITRALGASLLYHRPLSALLMPGRTGHLQLYSTTTDKILYNIDITEANEIPSERQNLLPLETEVTCAAISANGSWLVTSEYRNDGVNYPEEKLKFWGAQTKHTSPFKLNTCVNLSHGGCNVVSLALNNKGEFCVSAGADQKFRIWKRENTSQTHRKKMKWSCLTACYYSSGIAHFLSNPVLNDFKTGEILTPGKIETLPYMKDSHMKKDVIKRIFNIHKEHSFVDENVIDRLVTKDDESMGGVAISQDGSLIAAWFGCKLTLWDTHLCNLRTTLSHPALRPRGVHVQFGNNDAAHYLVCTTENCVAVWSLLSLTVKWMVQISTTCLVSDPLSNKMATVTTNNDVYIFNPHSSTPILVQKNLLNPKSGVFKHCAFGTSTGDDIRLYVMRNNSEIYCLEPEKSSEGRLEAISARNLPASNFSALLAEQQLSSVRPLFATASSEINKDALGDSAISQFLSAAPHMVPPVSLLCPLFLQHISGYEEVEESQDEENIMEVDPQSSDDEDVVVKSSYAPKPTVVWAPNYEVVKEKRLKRILKEPFLDLRSSLTLFGE